jgi:hypothetical protein
MDPSSTDSSHPAAPVASYMRPLASPVETLLDSVYDLRADLLELKASVAFAAETFRARTQASAASLSRATAAAVSTAATRKAALREEQLVAESARVSAAKAATVAIASAVEEAREEFTQNILAERDKSRKTINKILG